MKFTYNKKEKQHENLLGLKKLATFSVFSLALNLHRSKRPNVAKTKSQRIIHECGGHAIRFTLTVFTLANYENCIFTQPTNEYFES